MIQYDYGKTENGTIINISQVTKDNKEKYYCLSCNNELIPKIGKIREHHFAHRNINAVCSKETYFHILGKKIFYNTYLECIENNTPFYIGIKEIQCKNNKNYKCGDINNSNYNLLDYFNEIEMEKHNEEFIPDLRIFNKDKKEDIFIEIYYSNRVSDKKIESKKRIIEIQIKNEDDLKIIENKIFNEGNDKLRFYNFKRKSKKNERCNYCIFSKKPNKGKIILFNTADLCKYIVLRYDGKIECKIDKSLKSELIKKFYRNIKKVDPSIDYNIQYNEFVEDCKNKKMKIKENDFW